MPLTLLSSPPSTYRLYPLALSSILLQQEMNKKEMKKNEENNLFVRYKMKCTNVHTHSLTLTSSIQSDFTFIPLIRLFESNKHRLLPLLFGIVDIRIHIRETTLRFRHLSTWLKKTLSLFHRSLIKCKYRIKINCPSQRFVRVFVVGSGQTSSDPFNKKSFSIGS